MCYLYCFLSLPWARPSTASVGAKGTASKKVDMRLIQYPLAINTLESTIKNNSTDDNNLLLLYVFNEVSVYPPGSYMCMHYSYLC